MKTKTIWLQDSCIKKTSQNIEFKERKVIYPNRFKVNVKSIILISTLGADLEKNYCKVITTKGILYYDGSMLNLRGKLNLRLVQISKFMFVVPSRIFKTLGVNYLFLKHLDYPVKVSKVFINNIKQYIGYDK